MLPRKMAKPLGVTLPMRRGANGYFENTIDPITQVKSNLSNLLLTQKGERPMQPTFGSRIYSYIFEPETDDAFANLQAVIEESVAEWMPFVQILDVTKNFNTLNGVTTVTVTFTTLIDLSNIDNITLAF
jgi:phage baseplate assembly protein W